MAGINESLKKLTYESLQQFVEDINRNFAIIQNSPLYKGIPGEEGEEGARGARGERGSRFFFIDTDKFFITYNGEVVNINSVNQVWINQQINDLIKKEKLLKFFNVNSFVDTDIIVLNNSKMIQYNAIDNIFEDSGISFYQQNTLISSIENKLELLVKQYVDNNPKILSLKNTLINYRTYAKVYSSTNNTYISQSENDSAVFMPYFAGITDNQGILIPTHNYFGVTDELYPIDNNGTFIIGSVARYATLISNTLNVTEKATFSSDFAPTRNNLPNLVILQDSANNGIMFGPKDYNNLSRFASIYKDTKIDSNINEYFDSDQETNNLVLKSDQGVNLVDFSKLLINRYRLRYNKLVFFDDNLTVAKDFHLIGNIENKFIRTSEFINSKYTEKDNTNTNKRANTIEIGANVDDSILINNARITEFPYLADKDKLIVLTVSRPITNASLSKKYFVEEGSFSDSSDKNLNDFVFNKITTYNYDENYAFIRTPHIKALTSKINNIQKYVKNNYWRIDEWTSIKDNRGDQNGVIPILNVGNSHISLNSFIVYNGENRSNNERIINVDGTSNTLTLGFSNDANQTSIKFPSKTINFSLYNNSSSNKKDIQNKQIVTVDDSGNLINTGVYTVKTYEIIKEFNNKFNIQNTKTFEDEDEDTLINVKTLISFNNLLIEKFTDINNIYWKKSEFANPADGLTDTINVGEIPNIYVKNALGGKYLKVTNNLLNGNKSELTPTNEIKLQSKKIIINSENIIFDKNINYILVTDNSGKLLNKYIFETVDLEAINKNNYRNSFNFKNANDTSHVLTSNYFTWLNDRINAIVTNRFDDIYYLKSEFIGDKDKNFIIPTLNLKESLTVTGNVTFFDSDKLNSYFSIDDKKLLLGYDSTVDDSKVNLISKDIKLNDSKFHGKVLVTWEKDQENNNETDDSKIEDKDAETIEENESYTNIKHEAGEIRTDIEICNDSGLTENNDNEVPLSSTDMDKAPSIITINGVKIKKGSADAYKTKDKHKLLTGRTLKWIMKFMNNVKNRFLQTFNKEETIKQIHDVLPIGSIIMWTNVSYELSYDKYGTDDKGISRSPYRFHNKIPNGWWPCDGSKINGTKYSAPDLRNKFVRGVSQIDNTGTTGGRNKYKIEEGQLPNLKHTHIIEQTGNHNHLLVTDDTEISYYTGEFVYDNDLTSIDTVRQKVGTPCDIDGIYTEDSPITVPAHPTTGSHNLIKLKNIKLPVIITRVSGENIVLKNNWFVENLQKDATIGGKVFKFPTTVSAGISLFDFVNDFIRGNAFKLVNKESTNSLNVSLHSHPVNETGLGMSTSEKQGYIYTVPEYYSVIYIIKYSDASDTNIHKNKVSREEIGDISADDGSNYLVPKPDQKGTDNRIKLQIKVTTNQEKCFANINDFTNILTIYQGNMILLTAIPAPRTDKIYYQLRYWKYGDEIIENSYSINEVGEKIGKKQIAVIPPLKYDKDNNPITHIEYTAIFDVITIEPEPIEPELYDPVMELTLKANLTDYKPADIESIDFNFKCVDDNSIVTIKTKNS